MERSDERSVAFGTALWAPSAERLVDANLRRFADELAEAGHGLADVPDAALYDALLDWSLQDVGHFWAALDDYFGTGMRCGDGPVVTGPIDAATWFPGGTTNYAVEVLERAADLEEAVVSIGEDGDRRVVSGQQLGHAVRHLAGELHDLGVRSGDVVAGYLPNGLEAVIALLASAYLGATWTSCPPEFGATSVLDRFAQVAPKVLVAVDRSTYRGRVHDRTGVLAELRAALPSLTCTLVVGAGEATYAEERRWTPRTEAPDDAAPGGASPEPVRVAADHPLWILYSSGTTGIPKAIVHGHGGILLEQLKVHHLHFDLRPGDRLLWFSTTGWVMWNISVSALLAGATVVTYDGDPMHPDVDRLWRIAANERLTFLGLSAGHYQEFLRQGRQPRSHYDLTSLRSLGSTGSPLTPEANAWIYENVADDVAVLSISGGSDVATAFVGGSACLPVRAGVLARPYLGVDAAAFDPDGQAVVDQLGDFVVRRPMPSMPVRFWGDEDRSRLRAAYFDTYPGVWRHGDWITFAPDRSSVIHGRSDATLNRGGVRMGSGEFYRVLDGLEDLDDSLVIDTASLDAPKGQLVVLFVAAASVAPAIARERIVTELTRRLSPRHRPDHVVEVPAIPRTLSGRRMEIPVKRLLLGADPATAIERGAVADETALDAFLRLDWDALLGDAIGQRTAAAEKDGA